MEELKTLRPKLDAAYDRLDTLTERRKELSRALVAAGVSARAVAEVAGVSDTMVRREARA